MHRDALTHWYTHTATHTKMHAWAHTQIHWLMQCWGPERLHYRVLCVCVCQIVSGLLLLEFKYEQFLMRRHQVVKWQQLVTSFIGWWNFDICSFCKWNCIMIILVFLNWGLVTWQLWNCVAASGLELSLFLLSVSGWNRMKSDCCTVLLSVFNWIVCSRFPLGSRPCGTLCLHLHSGLTAD